MLTLLGEVWATRLERMAHWHLACRSMDCGSVVIREREALVERRNIQMAAPEILLRHRSPTHSAALALYRQRVRPREDHQAAMETAEVKRLQMGEEDLGLAHLQPSLVVVRRLDRSNPEPRGLADRVLAEQAVGPPSSGLTRLDLFPL